jgi:S-DNA-T family DNA segregation ATPase FtsK/SpoIIIE
MECWDAWRPVPFGRDAHHRRIDLPLVWTSLLVGAIPRQGKTFAIRLPAAGLILDPYTRLYVFDGKGGKDWDAAEAVAYRFVRGDDLDHAYAVRNHLAELVAEVQSRFARIATLDDEVCSESKITPAMSRDPNLGMPVTAVIIDEVHVFLENPTREQIGGKKSGSTALHVGGGGVVWELEVDGSAGEHDGGQRGLGTVEAVGAADDQAYLVVQSFLAAV